MAVLWEGLVSLHDRSQDLGKLSLRISKIDAQCTRLFLGWPANNADDPDLAVDVVPLPKVVPLMELASFFGDASNCIKVEVKISDPVSSGDHSLADRFLKVSRIYLWRCTDTFHFLYLKNMLEMHPPYVAFVIGKKRVLRPMQIMWDHDRNKTIGILQSIGNTRICEETIRKVFLLTVAAAGVDETEPERQEPVVHTIEDDFEPPATPSEGAGAVSPPRSDWPDNLFILPPTPLYQQPAEVENALSDNPAPEGERGGFAQPLRLSSVAASPSVPHSSMVIPVTTRQVHGVGERHGVGTPYQQIDFRGMQPPPIAPLVHLHRYRLGGESPVLRQQLQTFLPFPQRYHSSPELQHQWVQPGENAHLQQQHLQTTNHQQQRQVHQFLLRQQQNHVMQQPFVQQTAHLAQRFIAPSNFRPSMGQHSLPRQNNAPRVQQESASAQHPTSFMTQKMAMKPILRVVDKYKKLLDVVIKARSKKEGRNLEADRSSGFTCSHLLENIDAQMKAASVSITDETIWAFCSHAVDAYNKLLEKTQRYAYAVEDYPLEETFESLDRWVTANIGSGTAPPNPSASTPSSCFGASPGARVPEVVRMLQVENVTRGQTRSTPSSTSGLNTQGPVNINPMTVMAIAEQTCEEAGVAVRQHREQSAAASMPSLSPAPSVSPALSDGSDQGTPRPSLRLGQLLKYNLMRKKKELPGTASNQSSENINLSIVRPTQSDLATPAKTLETRKRVWTPPEAGKDSSMQGASPMLVGKPQDAPATPVPDVPNNHLVPSTSAVCGTGEPAERRVKLTVAPLLPPYAPLPPLGTEGPVAEYLGVTANLQNSPIGVALTPDSGRSTDVATAVQLPRLLPRVPSNSVVALEYKYSSTLKILPKWKTVPREYVFVHLRDTQKNSDYFVFSNLPWLETVNVGHAVIAEYKGTNVVLTCSLRDKICRLTTLTSHTVTDFRRYFLHSEGNALYNTVYNAEDFRRFSEDYERTFFESYLPKQEMKRLAQDRELCSLFNKYVLGDQRRNVDEYRKRLTIDFLAKERQGYSVVVTKRQVIFVPSSASQDLEGRLDTMTFGENQIVVRHNMAECLMKLYLFDDRTEKVLCICSRFVIPSSDSKELLTKMVLESQPFSLVRGEVFQKLRLMLPPHDVVRNTNMVVFRMKRHVQFLARSIIADGKNDMEILIVYLEAYNTQEGQEVIFIENDVVEKEGRRIDILLIPNESASKYRHLWLDKQLHVSHYRDEYWRVHTSELEYSSVLSFGGGGVNAFRTISELKYKRPVLTSRRAMDSLLKQKTDQVGRKRPVIRRWESLFVSNSFDKIHLNLVNENSQLPAFSANVILETRPTGVASLTASPSTQTDSQVAVNIRSVQPKKTHDLASHAILQGLLQAASTTVQMSEPNLESSPGTNSNRIVLAGKSLCSSSAKLYPDLPDNLRECALTCAKCGRTYRYFNRFKVSCLQRCHGGSFDEFDLDTAVTCSVCLKAFPNFVDYCEHLDEEELPDEKLCVKCQQTFSSVRMLFEHGCENPECEKDLEELTAVSHAVTIAADDPSSPLSAESAENNPAAVSTGTVVATEGRAEQPDSDVSEDDDDDESMRQYSSIKVESMNRVIPTLPPAVPSPFLSQQPMVQIHVGNMAEVPSEGTAHTEATGNKSKMGSIQVLLVESGDDSDDDDNDQVGDEPASVYQGAPVATSSSSVASAEKVGDGVSMSSFLRALVQSRNKYKVAVTSAEFCAADRVRVADNAKTGQLTLFDLFHGHPALCLDSNECFEDEDFLPDSKLITPGSSAPSMHECNLCLNKLVSLEDLEKHQIVMHLKPMTSVNVFPRRPAAAEFECNLCLNKFQSEEENERHLIAMHLKSMTTQNVFPRCSVEQSEIPGSVWGCNMTIFEGTEWKDRRYWDDFSDFDVKQNARSVGEEFATQTLSNEDAKKKEESSLQQDFPESRVDVCPVVADVAMIERVLPAEVFEGSSDAAPESLNPTEDESSSNDRHVSFSEETEAADSVKLYYCSQCEPEILLTQQDFVSHAQKHTNIQVIWCPVGTTQEQKFFRKVRVNISKDDEFKAKAAFAKGRVLSCKLCSYCTRNIKEFKSHVETFHK